MAGHWWYSNGTLMVQWQDSGGTVMGHWWYCGGTGGTVTGHWWYSNGTLVVQ